MKIKILVLCLLLVFTSIPAFAMIDVDNLAAQQDFVLNTVDVTGTYKAPVGSTLTAVIASGAGLTDGNIVTAYEYTIEQADGNIAFSIPMPDDGVATGSYTLFVRGTLMSDVQSISFEYKNPVDFARSILDDINDEAEENLIHKIFEYQEYLGVDASIEQEDWFDYDAITAILCGLKPESFTTTLEVRECMSEAVAVFRVNAAASSEELDALIAEYAAALGVDLEAYNQIGSYIQAGSEEEKTAAMKALRLDVCRCLLETDFANADTFADALMQSMILNEISEAESWGVLRDLMLETYADKLAIPDDTRNDYEDLKDKSAVFKAMLGTKFESIDQIVSTFTNEVDNCLEEEDNSNSGGDDYRGGGGGGGGSRGSSGSSFTAPLPPKTDDTDTEDTSNEVDTPEVAFGDIADVPWAQESIAYLYEAGIVDGHDGNFYPEQLVKREEFVKMLVLAAGLLDENATCNFTDVSEDFWAYSSIASAVQAGVVNGIGDGAFGCGMNISRQDMAVMVCHVLGAGDSVDTNGEEAFTDSEEIADYAREAVTVMQQMGLINGVGDGRFAPRDPVTRAQAAKVIHMMLTKGGIAE